MLEQITRTDRGASGLLGTLAIGVLSESEETWWNARVDGALSSKVDVKPAPEANALMMLGVAEARAIAEDGVLPSVVSLAQVEGDRLLMEQFLERYLARCSGILLRTTVAAGPKGRK